MASFVLSFFPLDVLDEIWAKLSQLLRFFLPTLMHFLILYQSYRSQRVLKGVTTVPLLYFEHNNKCYLPSIILRRTTEK